MVMTIEEAIKKFRDSAEHELMHGLMRSCLKYRQIAEWLEQLRMIKKIVETWEADTWTDGLSYACILKIIEVLEDGKNN